MTTERKMLEAAAIQGVYAFEVGLRGEPNRSTVNSITLGKAKAEFLHSIQDFWPGAKFTDVVGRRVGPAYTSAAFLRTAKYRGMPDLRCGDSVTVNGRRGFVVGHNDSANFDVLFAEGDWKGCVLNCHPCDFRRAAAAIGERMQGG